MTQDFIRLEQGRRRLAESVLDASRKHKDGRNLPIPGLRLSVVADHAHEPNCFYDLSVGLILQGDKKVRVGSKDFAYGEGTALVTTADVPASYELLNISPKKPFISTSLKLDPLLISELLQAQPEILERHKNSKDNRIFMLSAVSEQLIDAFERLYRIMETPEQIRILSPMVIREIHFYLLSSEMGASLSKYYTENSVANRINKTIIWVRNHYRDPLDIDKLTDIACMTRSTFYRHFKLLTTVSPLQYQKRLRLLEANRLLKAKGYSATQAALEVGYQSPQQFSREYKRTFGEPPRRSVGDSA